MQFSVAEFLLHLGDAIGSGRFNYGPLRIPFVPGRNDLAPFDHAAMKLFGGLNPVDAYRAQDCSRNLSYDRASCGRRYNYGWNPRAVAMPDARRLSGGPDGGDRASGGATAASSLRSMRA